ncbi:hypothetical protein PG994_005280 [Apiospora phragmitis]|uniref:Uncharacterized protein n=1 Tax=Apiospora phragmitis TaxID=2905665 RepID=A0ABR1VBT5_9PEZI
MTTTTTTLPMGKATVAASVFLAVLSSTAAAAQDDVCPYDGGWSLRVKSRYCPSSAPVDCGTGTQRRCCPAGPGRPPRCPNQQWTLWGGDSGSVDNGAWCCEPGYNGFYRGKVEGVGCTDAGVNTLPGNTFFAKTVSTSQCATATPTTSSSSSSGGGGAVSPPTATPTSPVADGQNAGGGTSDDNGQGLGSGAIAGIVVGCIAGVALLAGIVGAVLWRRRRNSQAAAAQELHSGSSPGGYPQDAYGQHQQATAMRYAGADGSVGGYSGSTAGGGGWYAPSPPGQHRQQQGGLAPPPQMKENTTYSPPVELPYKHRHLIGDQRADSHEMP